MKSPYYLKKRGAFWYYRLNLESGLVAGENLTYYTTGCRTREAAEAFMTDMIGEERETPAFRSYAESFFIWEQCPHIRRVLEETGQFTQRRAEIESGDRWLTPHSFRHTINTIVRDSGHDPAKIRAVLGWMDEEIQDNYTHWEAEHLRHWAEIVDDIWG